MLRTIVNFFKKKTTGPPSQIDQCIGQLKALDPYRFTNVYSSDMGIISMFFLFPTIEVFENKINKASNALKDDAIIYKSEYLLDLQQKTISEFFLTKEGYYLDPIEVGQRWIQASIDFLIIYKERDHEIESTVTTGHNLKVVYQLVHQIDGLTKILYTL